MKYEIEKHSYGSRRWWVVEVLDEWPHKRNLRGCKTKKKATLVKRMFEGDLSVAPDWYRMEVKDALKMFDENEAYRSAVLSAQSLGLTPGQCNADPGTGRPNPE